MSDTTRENLRISISTCAICDKGRDPLDVPGESCGHDGSNRRTVLVPVVPAADFDSLLAENARLLEAGEALAQFYDGAMEAAGRCGDDGEALSAAWREAVGAS